MPFCLDLYFLSFFIDIYRQKNEKKMLDLTEAPEVEMANCFDIRRHV